MKKFVIVLVVFALFALGMMPALADGEHTCSLSIQSQTVNHVEVYVATGAAWVRLSAPNSIPVDAQNGDTKGFDLDYGAGPYQTITGRVLGDSQNCGSVSVTIREWETGGNGGDIASSVNHSDIVPVESGSKSSVCVQMNGWRDAKLPNKWHFVITLQGQNPERPITVDFGDGKS